MRVYVDCVGRRRRRRVHRRMTWLGASMMTGRRLSNVGLTVGDVEQFEVIERTTEGVGVARAGASNDEVRGAGGADVAATAHVELSGLAERLRVDRSRQRRQHEDGDREDAERTGTNISNSARFS